MPTRTDQSAGPDFPFWSEGVLERVQTRPRPSAATAARLSAALAHVPSGSSVARCLPGWLNSHAPSTASTYLLRVLVWLEFCAAQPEPVDPISPDLERFTGFTQRVLVQAPAGPEGTPRSASTRAGIESACADLLRYAHAADVAGVRNRFAEAKRPRRPRRHTKRRPRITTEQLRQLVDAAGRDGMMNAATPGRWGSEAPEGSWSPLGPLIVGMLGWIGMRIGAVTARCLDDVGHDENHHGEPVAVLAGTDKGDEVDWEFTPELSATLWSWLRYREQLVGYYGDVQLGDALLVSPKTGRAVTSKQARNLLHRCAARAGLGRINPHDLRAGFARLARSLGADERDLQQAMHHAHIETTRLYGVDADKPAADPANRLRGPLAPVWPAPSDPEPPSAPAPDTCGCGSLPWSVLTASLEPWGYPGQAVVVQPAPECYPASATQLQARCCCGVPYPPGRPVRVVGFVATGADEQFQRMLTEQGVRDAL